MTKRKLSSRLGLVAVVPLAVGAVACDVPEGPVDPGIDEPINDFDDGLDDGLDG